MTDPEPPPAQPSAEPELDAGSVAVSAFRTIFNTLWGLAVLVIGIPSALLVATGEYGGWGGIGPATLGVMGLLVVGLLVVLRLAIWGISVVYRMVRPPAPAPAGGASGVAAASKQRKEKGLGAAIGLLCVLVTAAVTVVYVVVDPFAPPTSEELVARLVQGELRDGDRERVLNSHVLTLALVKARAESKDPSSILELACEESVSLSNGLAAMLRARLEDESTSPELRQRIASKLAALEEAQRAEQAKNEQRELDRIQELLVTLDTKPDLFTCKEARDQLKEIFEGMPPERAKAWFEAQGEEGLLGKPQRLIAFESKLADTPVLAALRKHLDALPQDEAVEDSGVDCQGPFRRGWSTLGRRLLELGAERFPKELEGLIEGYLAHDTTQRRYTVLSLTYRYGAKSMPKHLVRRVYAWIDETGPCGAYYENEREVEGRLCDEVAQALRRCFEYPDPGKFDNRWDEAKRDAAREVLKGRLAKLLGE
jgi:hypothetical protein